VQEVVILLSKLITQIGLILTSKADHLFDAFGISTDKVQLEPEPLNKSVSGFLCLISEGNSTAFFKKFQIICKTIIFGKKEPFLGYRQKLNKWIIPLYKIIVNKI
jgi:hypothetical protein